MSPANNRHGMRQADLAHVLSLKLPAGKAIVECSILTVIGVRVPDVCWASDAFLAAHGDDTPFMNAPEICIEVLSPWNSRREIDEKTQAYLAAGAFEVWVVGQDGHRRVFTADGEQVSSRFVSEI
ncbi:MAG: Uma2 family endonuclease [Proteobacteria bacterium]|nr:Uma2 family endonuclease [Burkholderiales bacterium]